MEKIEKIEINFADKLAIIECPKCETKNPKTFDELNVTGIIKCPNENCEHTLFLQINY